MGYKPLSVVWTGVQKDAVLSNFSGAAFIFILFNFKNKDIKTSIKVTFRSTAT